MRTIILALVALGVLAPAAHAATPDWWSDVKTAPASECTGGACGRPHRAGLCKGYLRAALVDNTQGCTKHARHGRHGAYCSIQAAICAVRAGGTVTVQATPVPYAENLYIPKPITLTSSDPQAAARMLPYSSSFRVYQGLYQGLYPAVRDRLVRLRAALEAARNNGRNSPPQSGLALIAERYNLFVVAATQSDGAGGWAARDDASVIMAMQRFILEPASAHSDEGGLPDSVRQAFDDLFGRDQGLNILTLVQSAWSNSGWKQVRNVFPALTPPDGSKACINVRIKPGVSNGVRIIGLQIEAPAYLTQPCIDVDSPYFVLQNSWVIGDPNDDAVLVRSGLAAISANEIVNADVGVRLTGRHEMSAAKGFAPGPFAYARKQGPALYGGPMGAPGRRFAGAVSYNPGMHIVSDNFIHDNNIGLQVTGDTDVYAARNVIFNNWTIGVQNMNGGGAYTSNYVSWNGNGFAFVYDTTANDAAWMALPQHENERGKDPLRPASDPPPNTKWSGFNNGAKWQWPVRAPMIVGNAIRNNSNAGVLVLADSPSLAQGYEQRPPLNTVAKTLLDRMGTVWGNCISGNSGHAIDLRGVSPRATRAALAGDDDGADKQPLRGHAHMPRNNIYENGGPWWGSRSKRTTPDRDWLNPLEWVMDHPVLVGYPTRWRNCEWFPDPAFANPPGTGR